MGKTDKPVYVAYIGTTKVAFLKAILKGQDQFEAASLSARLAHGFEGGIVKDLSEAAQTLGAAVEDITGPGQRSIASCRLIISNVYLKSYTFQSSIYFQGNPHPLTLKDVREAIAQTRSVANIPLQEMIIQSVPQEFLVNDLIGVQNPLGLEASRLGVTLRLLTLDFLVYSNLMRVFERCDLEVTEIIPSILSAAHGVLTPQEKQTGVLLVLIGGGATHFACFKNSVLLETRSIPIGGDSITDVIAKNLNVEHLDAQRIKETFGSATPKTEFRDELIPIPDSNGKKKHSINRIHFEAEMDSGLRIFFSKIQEEIHTLQKRYSPLNQVVFTGGGAGLDGFLEVMRDTVSPVSRIGTVQNFHGPGPLLKNPAFSAAIGGISYSSRISERDLSHTDHQNWVSRTVAVARNWIFEYL